MWPSLCFSQTGMASCPPVPTPTQDTGIYALLDTWTEGLKQLHVTAIFPSSLNLPCVTKSMKVNVRLLPRSPVLRIKLSVHVVCGLFLQGIVGNLSSGKSALVHRYLTGTYVQEESPEGETRVSHQIGRASCRERV